MFSSLNGILVVVDSFWWDSLDGSSVVANGEVTSSELIVVVNNLLSRPHADLLLCPRHFLPEEVEEDEDEVDEASSLNTGRAGSDVGSEFGQTNNLLGSVLGSGSGVNFLTSGTSWIRATSRNYIL